MAVEIWTVYDRPDSYPNDFVAVRWIDRKPTNGVLISPSLDDVSAALENMGFVCLRVGEDDTKIIQVWMRKDNLRDELN